MDPALAPYVLEGPLDGEAFLDCDRIAPGSEEERLMLVEQALIERWNRTITDGLLFGGPGRAAALEAIRSIAAEHDPKAVSKAFHLIALGNLGSLSLAEDLAVWRLVWKACLTSSGACLTPIAAIPQ